MVLDAVSLFQAARSCGATPVRREIAYSVSPCFTTTVWLDLAVVRGLLVLLGRTVVAVLQAVSASASAVDSNSFDISIDLSIIQIWFSR